MSALLERDAVGQVRSETTRMVGFGASHLNAIAEASTHLEASTGLQVATVPFHAFEPTWRDNPSGRSFNPLFTSRLQFEINSAGTRLVFCSLGGGDHIALGILNSERPFDFIIPDAETDDVVRQAQRSSRRQAGTEIIPFDLVRETIASRAGGSVSILQLVRAMTDLPLIVAAPPPPIADEAQIRRDPNPEFQRQLQQQGLSPRILTYKLWLVCVSNLREMAGRFRASVITPPREAIGPDGFLAASCFGQDCMHANAHYGRLVVNQLAAIAQSLL